MAGKPLRRLSPLTLFPLLLMLLPAPANVTQKLPTGQAPPRTELLYPAITLDQTTGPITVTEALRPA